MKKSLSLRLIGVALCALPCAFGYIGETFTTGTPAQTIQITRADSAGLQFYINTQVAAGATSTLAGTQSPVIATGSTPVAAVEAAMATWNNVGASSLNFAALQTTTVGHDSTDCKNVISIAATTADLSVLGFVSAASPGVVAATANAYIQGSGAVCGGSTAVPAGTIIDSDIVMNPYFAFSTNGAANTKDVQAVITHEFGHMLGMNHSGLLSATMYPYSFQYQRHLSWDEKSFLTAYYPSGKTTLGTIKGTVTLGSTPVVYGLVTMTELSGTGKVIGTLTAADGTFSAQVPVGTYNVYVEPFNSFIGASNIYSLATGTLSAAAATTGYQATFSGGNTSSPPAFAVTSGSSVTANISVVSGATPLALPFYGIGSAGGKGDVQSFSSIVSAIPVTAGTSFDLAVTGSGLDSTITFAYIGTNVTVVGTPRVDPSGTVNGNPIIRQTFSVGTQTNTTMGSLWIIKGSNFLPLSGILDIEPSTPLVNNIIDAESSRSTITSGQYVAIYGSNLSNTTRTWSAANDFTGGTAAGSPLPTSLDGVSVTVNSQPAAVYFVSPGQINFIAPSNLATGAASIVVSNQASNAATYKTTNVGPAAPSFFIYAAGGNYYPAAVRLSDLKTVGDPSVLGGTEKALPGDTIIMFGNGLAPEPGNVVVTPAALNGTISITGTSGSNTFTAASVAAALVYAGEFQINVTLPATLPAGNYTLTMTVPNGSTAGTGLSVILPVGP